MGGVSGGADRRLTIVIPARNEAATIGTTLADLGTWSSVTGTWRTGPVHLLVVDDYSTDGTAAIAARYADVVANRADPGYGNAVTTGLLLAHTERVTVMTADGSDSPFALTPFAVRSGVVFADRWRGRPPRTYPRVKRHLNRLGNHMIGTGLTRRYGLPYYTDWTDPFKSYPTDLVQRVLAVRPLPNDMSAGLALAIRAARCARTFSVVPTTWQGRTAGISKFRRRDPLVYLCTALREGR